MENNILSHYIMLSATHPCLPDNIIFIINIIYHPEYPPTLLMYYSFLTFCFSTANCSNILALCDIGECYWRNNKFVVSSDNIIHQAHIPITWYSLSDISAIQIPMLWITLFELQVCYSANIIPQSH